MDRLPSFHSLALFRSEKMPERREKGSFAHSFPQDFQRIIHSSYLISEAKIGWPTRNRLSTAFCCSLALFEIQASLRKFSRFRSKGRKSGKNLKREISKGKFSCPI